MNTLSNLETEELQRYWENAYAIEKIIFKKTGLEAICHVIEELDNGFYEWYYLIDVSNDSYDYRRMKFPVEMDSETVFVNFMDEILYRNNKLESYSLCVFAKMLKRYFEDAEFFNDNYSVDKNELFYTNNDGDTITLKFSEINKLELQREYESEIDRVIAYTDTMIWTFETTGAKISYEILE